MKKVDFYEACRVPTSLYDENFAKTNINWLIAKKIYEMEEKSIVYEFEESLVESGIPRRIHFIWLGSELPKQYEEIVDTWKEHNPDHGIFVWGDKEVKTLVEDYADDHFKELYSQCANYGQKSDLLRYLILSEIGGIYADIDFVCLQNFNELHDCNFFAGICLEKEFQLNNGLIGCAPGHPIMDNVLERIDLKGFDHIACPHTRTLFQTGPWALTDAVKKYIFDGEELHDDIMLWPPNYFHPFPAAKRFEGNWEDYIKDYSLTAHLWECSWQK